MSHMAVSALIEALPSPALVIGGDDRVMAMNAPAVRLFEREAVGALFGTLIRKPDLLNAIEDVMSGADAQQRDWPVRGTEVVHRVNVSGVDLDGARCVLLVFQDVTAQHQSDQMRSDFVANVSHELRTPLTSLLGFIETLQGPARDDRAAQERFLGIMASEAERMNRLIADLLSLSRVEAEARVEPDMAVDLRALVTSVCAALAPLAAKTDARLGHDAEQDAPLLVRGDMDQLRQVVTNLVENALRYGGAGVTVQVSLSEPSYQTDLRRDGVRLAVKDTGPGIAEHHIARLTERFYRVDAHRSREMGGTGLGLAIVKHIVTRHRGRLKVTSTQGNGATFTVILPVAD